MDMHVSSIFWVYRGVCNNLSVLTNSLSYNLSPACRVRVLWASLKSLGAERVLPVKPHSLKFHYVTDMTQLRLLTAPAASRIYLISMNVTYNTVWNCSRIKDGSLIWDSSVVNSRLLRSFVYNRDLLPL